MEPVSVTLGERFKTGQHRSIRNKYWRTGAEPRADGEYPNESEEHVEITVLPDYRRTLTAGRSPLIRGALPTIFDPFQ